MKNRLDEKPISPVLEPGIGDGFYRKGYDSRVMPQEAVQLRVHLLDRLVPLGMACESIRQSRCFQVCGPEWFDARSLPIAKELRPMTIRPAAKLAAVVVQNSPDADSVLIECLQNIFVQVQSYLSYLHTAVNPDKLNMLSSNFVLNTYFEEQSIAVARFERSSKITDK